MGSRNLLQIPLLRKLITARWPQLIVRGIALGVFILVILAGLFGTPVGNQNLSIVLIWIAWWAVLILILVPFLGRSWCKRLPPAPSRRMAAARNGSWTSDWEKRLGKKIALAAKTAEYLDPKWNLYYDGFV